MQYYIKLISSSILYLYSIKYNMKVRPSQDKDIPAQRYILGMIPITILWCFKKRKVHPTEKKALYEIFDDK
uniref:Uncharacterized protein n=1 Tax=viral metagenome TaxID=1070528 RepID=A0A6C0LGT2_9ZZZZ